MLGQVSVHESEVICLCIVDLLFTNKGLTHFLLNLAEGRIILVLSLLLISNPDIKTKVSKTPEKNIFFFMWEAM